MCFINLNIHSLYRCHCGSCNVYALTVYFLIISVDRKMLTHIADNDSTKKSSVIYSNQTFANMPVILTLYLLYMLYVTLA